MPRNGLTAVREYARTLCLVAIVSIASTGATTAYAQVPPPPSLPGQSDLATKLADALLRKDAVAYAGLLADDLQVYEDGRRVASGKHEWMASFGKKLVAPGVQFKMVSGYSSTGRLLFIEYFSSLASWGRTPPPDCCWSYDAVAYDVADGKIIKIQRLRGGDAKLNEGTAGETERGREG